MLFFLFDELLLGFSIEICLVGLKGDGVFSGLGED
jgi:hypothetical protein